MTKYTLGTYKYHCTDDIYKLDKLPEQLKMNNISACGVLLELMMGGINILDHHDEILFTQKINFTKLPYVIQEHLTYQQFNDVLNTNVLDPSCCMICNKFLTHDKRNNFVYEHILNELTQFFLSNNLSSCEGFVHLYRILEFISYSFPLIYASKSRDYRGTYDSLKKFLNGDSGGELNFFKKFLNELFKKDIAYQFLFEVYIDSDHINELKKEFQEIFQTDIFTFEENTLIFKFKNVTELFIEIRNRYFHMLLGKGKNNFLNMNYNKSDLFQSLNPVFLNWLVIIFIKIIQHGLEASDL
ncbi:MAG: hypothetical protein HFI71_02915 [Lachnospiraceae bacterium]|nr:hypothetical protein [Lachnospiraceae bacterium]